jgi:hypothetical protein
MSPMDQAIRSLSKSYPAVISQRKRLCKLGHTYRRYVVVGTDDVKVATGEPTQHIGDGLLWRPGAIRFGLSTSAFAGMNPSRTEKNGGAQNPKRTRRTTARLTRRGVHYTCCQGYYAAREPVAQSKF